MRLTRKQREHYELIFRLNDHSSPPEAAASEWRLKIAELSRYMESLGHGVPTKELVSDAFGCLLRCPPIPSESFRLLPTPSDAF